MQISSSPYLLPALAALALTAGCEPKNPPADTQTDAHPVVAKPKQATSTYSCDTPDGRVRIDVDGGVYTCAEQPPEAIATGASAAAAFRGVGQEPGWLLYVLPEHWIDFRYDYGEQRVRTPDPEGTGEDGTTRYTATTETHDINVVIGVTECHDVMSGEAYPASVVVELDGRRFTGCGETLTADVTPGRYCYRTVTPPGGDPGGRDVQSLTVQIQGAFAQGRYDWLPAEKDARRGTFEGVLDGDTLQGVYEFSQEGQQDEVPIAIRLGKSEASVSGGAPELGLAATLPAAECQSAGAPQTNERSRR
jgi:uncharacterized membrane protein